MKVPHIITPPKAKFRERRNIEVPAVLSAVAELFARSLAFVSSVEKAEERQPGAAPVKRWPGNLAEHVALVADFHPANQIATGFGGT